MSRVNRHVSFTPIDIDEYMTLGLEEDTDRSWWTTCAGEVYAVVARADRSRKAPAICSSLSLWHDMRDPFATA